MTATTPTALERAIQRYGDDLYRLALLLTPDDASAATALRNAMRRLVDTPPAALTEPAMIQALVAALPSDRRHVRSRRLPAWAQLPTARAEARLIAALAHLPRAQRLALGLTILRGFEAAQAAPMLGGDEAHARALVRDALRALAPQVDPELAFADLDVDGAPEACHPTRAALALGGDLTHTDPAIRGHLALCDACRAAEQAWLRLSASVENALRGALRAVSMPEYLVEDLRAVSMRAPQLARPNLLANQRVRLVFVALVVLALIALLVLPRRAPAVVSPGATAANGPTLPPRDLVERALDRLYTPPSGSGIWHGRWEIRWSFAGGSYATLNADEWVDTLTSRHRLQLVHHDGGGPFEFELADESGDLWYATTNSYAPSLYPALFDPQYARVHLRLAPQDQARMLRARLESGAWDLAAAYLRQARAARDLRGWGRQRGDDGATLEVIGFSGFSPLAQPLDAPDSTAISTTMLLSIDTHSGALREVRELAGPEGGERNARTTWRFVQSEWLASPQDAAAVFDLKRAWNGEGSFIEQHGMVDPTLPLIPGAALTSLAQGIQNWSGHWMPASPPPGITRALAVDLSKTPAINLPATVIVYIGADRRLTIFQTEQTDNSDSAPAGSESVKLNGLEFVLHPTLAQGYRVRMVHEAPYERQLRTRINAQGYTRAELLDILRTFGPPSSEAYRAQARLFADPTPRDQASFDALLNALAPAPPLPSGMVRHFVERTFTRHSNLPDPLGDPYHLPPYGGRPEALLIDNWVRPAKNGAFEMASVTHSADGTVYGRQYLGPTTVWYYDLPMSQAIQVRPTDLQLTNQINQDQGIVFDLLARGGSQLVTLPNRTLVISSSQPLLESRYADVLLRQQQNPATDGGPYLSDVGSDATVTTLIYLGAEGRPKRIEARALSTASITLLSRATTVAPSSPGAPQAGTLLEAWELVSDEQEPADRVPAHTFDTTPPDAMTIWDSMTQNYSPELHTVTVTEALKLVPTPLWYLPLDDKNAPLLIEAVTAPAKHSPVGSDDVFDEALRRGFALRLRSWLPANLSTQRLTYLYEGAAEPFRTFLRSRSWDRPWQSSTPVQVRFGARTVDGWRMTLSDGAIWTLFEVDGTLLAIQTNDEVQQAALARLQPLQQP